MAMCQQVDSLIWNGPVFTLDEEKSDMKFVMLQRPKNSRQILCIGNFNANWTNQSAHFH